MKKVLLSSAVLLFTLAGCNAQSSSVNDNNKTSSYHTGVETETYRDHYFGLGPVSDYYAKNNNHDTGDSYMGNETPEFNNTSVKHFSISHDQDMIRYTVNHSDGFKAGAISIIGDQAYVNVSRNGNKADTDQSVKRLKQKLQFQMPRYTIHLKVNNR